MASGPANAPPDLKSKRGAVEAFRIVSRTLAPQQAEWLQSQGVDTERPATEQAGRLDAILVQAQIKVVEAMRSEATRKELSADDRVFLETKGINPEKDQDARIKELVTTLQQQENDALARQVTYDTQAPQVCSLCTVCVADVTWHLLHAGKHDAGRSCEDEAACVVPAQ